MDMYLSANLEYRCFPSDCQGKRLCALTCQPILENGDPAMYNAVMEMQETKPAPYRMPVLTDEFLYQVIFCMEDQSNDYCLDLKEGSLVQVEFVEQRKQQDPERFLDIPEWYPSDGFRTMEKFVSTLRNPVYRERLREALQSGKGVFRQFKDVLHGSPPLERLWYYYKDKEIRHRIHLWYERHDEAFRLSRMGESPEDGTAELLLEDFTYAWDGQEYAIAIQALGEKTVAVLCSSGRKRDELVAQQMKQAWDSCDLHTTLVALSDGGVLAAFVAYRLLAGNLAQVVCFAVEEEFQGLGLFRHMMDVLAQRLCGQGFTELIVPFAGESLKVEQMFDDVAPIALSKTISISLEHWRNDGDAGYGPDDFA